MQLVVLTRDRFGTSFDIFVVSIQHYNTSYKPYFHTNARMDSYDNIKARLIVLIDNRIK